jgi:hypothetical protein
VWLARGYDSEVRPHSPEKAQTMGWFILWLFLAILVGVFAQRRGRVGFGWFVLAVMFSPVLTWLVLLAIGPAKSAALVAASSPVADTRDRIPCPECRELVLRDARKCKHCGSVLVPH